MEAAFERFPGRYFRGRDLAGVPQAEGFRESRSAIEKWFGPGGGARRFSLTAPFSEFPPNKLEIELVLCQCASERGAGLTSPRYLPREVAL